MTGATVCPIPGCPHIRPCAQPGHEPVPWAGSTRHDRLPGNWPKLRRRILRRDPICCICHSQPSAEVDHIVAGDDHRPANLQGLCHPCHRAKTLAEATAGRRH